MLSVVTMPSESVQKRQRRAGSSRASVGNTSCLAGVSLGFADLDPQERLEGSNSLILLVLKGGGWKRKVIHTQSPVVCPALAPFQLKEGSSQCMPEELYVTGLMLVRSN